MSVVPRHVEIETLLLVVELHEPGKQRCRACDGRLGQESGLCRTSRAALERLAELGADGPKSG